MTEETLKTTPLTDLHIELGARMVPFAGYSMPVQFPLGVKQEHLHTRNQVGLFDVSHMGQLLLKGLGVAEALEALVPVDIVDLPVGKQRYALFTNEQGGIIDDLMVANHGDGVFFLVVNAARKECDLSHLAAHLPDTVTIERLDDRALIAVQGPRAAKVLARLQPAVNAMVFMDSKAMTIGNAECFVSRSGYTGEDGFEISIPSAEAAGLVKALLAESEVEAIGLGARDSLRLEAGLCLYGHDIDTTTTPLEASLIWAISKARRAEGVRPGGFLGDGEILNQMAHRGWLRKRVGLLGKGRAPVREGARLFGESGEHIGTVTSGTYGPSVGAPVAMGYVKTPFSALDMVVYAEVRGKKLPMTVSRMPFLEPSYYRG